MIKPVAAGPEGTELHKDGYQTKLEKTCAEFESIFITHMLKSMTTTLDDDPLLGNTNESQIIKAMFNENLAQEIAIGGGMGLGNMLFESLKDRNYSTDKIMNYR
ncbi:MAG: rod-binding protein [Desulfobacterales bacterium]|jgi:flagellar protein FlgJ